MRAISVLVKNIIERDAVLRAFERCGCRWVGGELPTQWHPAFTEFPYYIDRSARKIVSFGKRNAYEEMPAEKFLRIDKSHKVITIYSDGRTVKAVGKNGEIGMAKCNPEDEFSLEFGAKLAVGRMFDKSIKNGDEVIIEDVGRSYTRYYEFFRKHGLSIELAAKFCFGCIPPKGTKGIVRAVCPHCGGVETMIAVVEDGTKRVYLVNVEGLEKVWK